MIKSLRRFLFCGAFMLLPLALSGCGGNEEFASNSANNAVSGTVANRAAANAPTTTSTTVAAAPDVEPTSQPGKYGGNLTQAVISDPKTFNMWVAEETSSTGAVGGLYDALIGRNSYTLQWEMRLAESETVSPDGLTWTYKLRPGLKWSDGVPLTADDVIFTLDVIYDTKVQTNFREAMLLDAPDGRGGFNRVPLRYRKVDERTIEFKFPARYAPARSILSFDIAPKHKLEAAYRAGQPTRTGFNAAYNINTPVSELVSCGPWILTEYKHGQRLVYARNPNYWKHDAQGRPLPYLDGQVTLIVPDLNATTLKFRAGETDVLIVQLSDYPIIKAGEATGNYHVYDVGPSWNTLYLDLNLNPRSKPARDNPSLNALFRDVRFRRALSHSINRERIARAVYNGLASPLYGPESPANTLFYNPNIATFPYDPAKARGLLTQIGLRDSDHDGILEYQGKPVRFNILTNIENNQRIAIATIISDDLRKIGLGVTFTPIAFNNLVTRANSKPQAGQPYPAYDWQAIILGFTGGPEPNDARSIWNSSGNLHQWYPYQTRPDTPWEAEMDGIFRAGAQEMNPEKRKAIYQSFQALAAEQVPLIYTVVPDTVAAVRSGYGNLKPCSLGGVLWNLDEIYRLDATRDQP